MTYKNHEYAEYDIGEHWNVPKQGGGNMMHIDFEEIREQAKTAKMSYRDYLERRLVLMYQSAQLKMKDMEELRNCMEAFLDEIKRSD